MLKNVKAVCTLLIITLLSGAALGYVYELTKAPIEAQNAAAKEKAFKEVFKEANGFSEVEGLEFEAINSSLAGSGYESENVDDLLAATDSNGNVLGYVMQVTTKRGYVIPIGCLKN